MVVLAACDIYYIMCIAREHRHKGKRLKRYVKFGQSTAAAVVISCGESTATVIS